MLAYRLLATLVWLLAMARWALSALAARLTGRPLPLAERFRAPPVRQPTPPLVWLHGASNGELTAARPLAGAILARQPGVELLITANNPTARALAAGWGLPRTRVRLAPLDAGPPLRALLKRERPAILVIIENELWPLRLAECARRAIPVLVAGARMSDRSARNWAHLPVLAADLLGTVTWLAPQDDDSRARFIALGLDPDRIGPILSLKAAAAPADLPPAGEAPADRSRTLLAASTHEGEEEIILDAFLKARAARPDLRLILAPRHPRRSGEIAALIAGRGLAFSTRSRGEAPDAPVYLADTLGEMDLWYAAAGITFVGGSLAPRGGHTPFEPAAHGSAILYGTSTENFQPAYQALAAAGAAIAVSDTATLAAAVIRLADDAGAQSRLARSASAALAPLRTDAALADFLDRIDRALAPSA